MRSTIKTAVEAIEGKDADQARAKLREAISVLDRAASKGTLHRNMVSRKISRLSAQFHRTYQGQPQQQESQQ